MTITGYNRENQIEYQYELQNDTSSSICTLQSTIFLGVWCKADSLIVEFSNGKGYICDVREKDSSESICFPNDKSPYTSEGSPIYRTTSDGVAEFLITEEDFENAFDLPE